MFKFIVFHRENPPKVFTLHLQRLLPKIISRCQGKYGQNKYEAEWLLVKSFGTSSWTDAKTGAEKSRYGPMYIHFHDNRLKAFDKQHYYGIGEEFRYDQIKVDKTTAGNLNEEEKCELQRYGLTFLS